MIARPALPLDIGARYYMVHIPTFPGSMTRYLGTAKGEVENRETRFYKILADPASHRVADQPSNHIIYI